MMLALVLAAAVLAAATVWFLTTPLARGARAESREEYYQLLTYRDRLLVQLNELDMDERDRSMETDTVTDERARLQGELAAALKKIEALGPEADLSNEQGRSPAVWRNAIIAIALIVPLIGVSVYLANATVPFYKLEQAASAQAPITTNGAPDPLKMVARLEERLKSQPNDGRGWARLGRAYSVLGRIGDAEAAYAKAYKLLPDDPDVIGEYAAFLYGRAPTVTEGLVYTLYTKLHRLQPNSPDTLWFMGLATFKRGDAKTALKYWTQLQKQLPPESENAKQLQLIIQKAKEVAATPPTPSRR